MAQNLLQFASNSFRLKVQGFYFYGIPVCAQCHGNIMVDFYAVY